LPFLGWGANAAIIDAGPGYDRNKGRSGIQQ
jgi:hypothetical protein